MRIAVCIKQVPVSEQVKIDPVTHNLIRGNAEMTMNAADMNALTEIIKLKESAEVILDVYTMGADTAKSILYTAIAMGADHGYLVTDRVFAGGDSLGTAKVLKVAMDLNGHYDVIVCGAFASDGATSQVGPMIAELSDIPSITNIKKIVSLDETKIIVAKPWAEKIAKLETVFPCLLTVALGCNNPILPTLRNQMKAKKKEIITITNEELKMDTSVIGQQGALSIVTDTYLKEQAGRQCEMIDGTVDEQAERIIQYLGA